MSYADKLRDPRWQRRRLQILERDRWCCQYCLDDTKTLHVHHKFYLAGKEPWEYDDDQLVTLCEMCHKYVSGRVDALKDALSRLPVNAIEVIEGFARAHSGTVWPDDKNLGVRVGAICYFNTYHSEDPGWWKELRRRKVAGA